MTETPTPPCKIGVRRHQIGPVAIKVISKEVVARLQARFWEHVDKRSEDECWLWTGLKGGNERNKYGKLDGYFVHRLSYAINYYDPPLDMAVCHSCDTPLCVNPRHLTLGTIKDNAVDAQKKGMLHIPGRHDQLSVSIDTELKIVGMMKSGTPAWQITKTLGIKNVQVVKSVLGRWNKRIRY